MANAPIVTLLTDFGLRDYYVSAMKGVMLGICPDARLIDITHQIDPFDIEGAAFTLAQAYPCFPAGTVHLVVVDPGVGSARRALVVEAGGHRFVAPDNGVLTFPMVRNPRHTAHEITSERYFRQPVSRTFHGRDIFAPVAAHLATGVPAGEIGGRIADAVRLDIGAPVARGEGRWSGKVLRVDHYGNVVTNFESAAFGEIETNSFEFRLGSAIVRTRHSCY